MPSSSIFSSFFWDPTFWLLVPTLLLALIAQGLISSRFSKYSRIPSRQHITAQEAVRKILYSHDITNVATQMVGGSLSDHYNPRKQVISLSQSVYNSASIGAIAVAAHEAGHAIQHSEGYFPLRIRNSIQPVASFASRLALPLLLLGMLAGIPELAYGAVFGFGLIFLFQLVTLPVEFNASRRALAALDDCMVLYPEERKGAKKVLSAAALTYVAAMLTSFVQVLRLLLILQNRGRSRH